MPSATYGFNGNPSSVSVKTGSYTIPANKYAYVTANCNAGETFSIDGTVALSSTSSEVNAVGASDTDSDVSYSVSSGYYFEGQAWANTTYSVTVGGKTIISGQAANAPTYLSAGPGQAIAISAPSATSVTITGFEVRNIGKNAVSASFWVPTGTVLTTSSGRYTVQLF